MKTLLSFFVSSLLLLVGQKSMSQATKHTFELSDQHFLLDGKPFQMISGEMHCERIPREYWRDRIRKAKAMGLNTVGTYVFWNSHEEEPGKYTFEGNNDIAEFVRIAKEEHMWVVMRPSPYACAEWEFGGYPYWLLKDSTLKVRSKDERFISAYRNYIKQLSKQLVPYLVTNGGNILMVQFENEYGSYSDDKAYLELNRKIFADAGFNGILFTCDGETQMPKGYLPGYLPAVNGLDDTAAVKKLINKYHDGKGPYYIAEWYPGWFDSWGKPHAKTGIDDAAKKLDEVLSAGISINMYMFHGGTTRGFMNGANMSKTEAYSPQTTSYDYDAPLDEAGNPTAKYLKFREVITKHLPKGTTLPPVPQPAPTIGIDKIALTQYASLYTNLPAPVVNKTPLCFEDLNQAYGFVLYRSKLKKGDAGLLKLNKLRDYAVVYLNKKRLGVLDRRLVQDSMSIDKLSADATLDIWVENNGRINYGLFLTDNRQGITESVTLNGAPVLNWSMYKFPFKTLGGIKFTTGKSAIEGPGIYKGTFSLTKTADTYLDLSQFGKGFVFLNGHNLGKYWEIGPQQTLYIPAGWLKVGTNEIEVFDQLKGDHKIISTLTHSILDQLASK
ncbi:glycoside hydrolase family 35 protein [Mucilaginibacter agri]|uniref:Beta-galactosidase n=1 Tax=Mucilaginibacter agri TaxID=2695265 RepID=A0A966DWF3_9SPHI|nr:glycoside hydrolase family 35 protein [Mucilaginibacter agri]NCD72457.1 beta-galactosidase [Mucilaginibacter agri]